MGTSMSLGQLIQPAQASVMAPEEAGMQQQKMAMEQGQMNAQGIQQGMALAQSAQKLESQKAELEAQKEALEKGKFDAYMGLNRSAIQMSDEWFKASEKQLENRAMKYLPDYQPGTFRAMRSNPESKAGMSAFLEALATGEIPNDPQLRQTVLGVAADQGQMEALINSYNERRKQKASENYHAATLNMSVRRQEDKLTHQDNIDWEKLAEKINSPATRSTIGRYTFNLDKVETLKKFNSTLGVKPGEVPPANETEEQRIKRFNSANPQDLFEVAKAADQLLTNANSTVYSTDHLMPKSLSILWGEAQQYIKGKPMGANAGEFVNKFINLANREGEYYKSARDKAIGGLAAGYKHLKSRDPERWDAVVNARNDMGESLSQTAPAASNAPMTEPQLTPSQQAFVKNNQKLLNSVNPRTGQNYTQQDILDAAKRVK